MKKSQKQFKVIIEKDEDGYFVASVPVLPGCHTQAKTYEEVIKRIREAILLCLEVQKVNRQYREKTFWEYQPKFFAVEDLIV